MAPSSWRDAMQVSAIQRDSTKMLPTAERLTLQSENVFAVPSENAQKTLCVTQCGNITRSHFIHSKRRNCFHCSNENRTVLMIIYKYMKYA